MRFDISSWAQKVFTDADDRPSFGRVASAYSLVGALACFTAGICMPDLATYCSSSMNTLLASSAGFYAMSKGQQVLSGFAQTKDSKEDKLGGGT